MEWNFLPIGFATGAEVALIIGIAAGSLLFGILLALVLGPIAGLAMAKVAHLQTANEAPTS